MGFEFGTNGGLTAKELAMKFVILQKILSSKLAKGALTVGLPPAWVDVYEEIAANVQRARTRMAELAKRSEKKLQRLSAAGRSEDSNVRKNVQEELTLIQQDFRLISEYLHAIKVLVDELVMIDSPVSMNDMTLYVLNGLGPKLCDIAATIRARETFLTFEELHDMLVGHKSYLKCIETSNSAVVLLQIPLNAALLLPSPTATNAPASVPLVRITPALVAKSCLVSLRFGSNDKKWLVDSTASHNITSDLANLSVHLEYDGTNEVFIGDGLGLRITHVGSMTFASSLKPFTLTNTLCVPNIHKNLIFVHNFTHSNNVYLEVHPFHFLMKDRSMGATLICGKCQDGVYPMPMASPATKSSVLALVGERTTFDPCHR
ncbi:uncharacterized protein LOC122306232 [Carya illinoinensis]|uniref:uncharacterized protein LOC122306232 n=1 Tax=Carya illinoinensis TaxID=32201 RepID=UPI001C726C3F|nr:uncharacterized protein LOC122306232 [Carya illinoinensis]